MKNYDSTINILGSIPDSNIIIESINFYNKTKDLNKLKEKFIKGNLFRFDLSSSRKRFFSGIKDTYLRNLNNEDKQLFFDSMSNSSITNRMKKNILYIETFRNNVLFKDIILDFVKPKWFDNRRLITTNETFEFLKSISANTELENWSDNTITMVARKFINFMRKLGKFKKENRYKHMFNFDYPDISLITYIIYLLKSIGISDFELYNSNIFDALMITKYEKMDLFKKASMKGYVKFSMSGNEKVQIDLIYDRKEILDEIF